jgi:tetratricopeptide (TPR) repeat protein
MDASKVPVTAVLLVLAGCAAQPADLLTRRLDAAAKENPRPIEGRLTGGFGYRVYRPGRPPSLDFPLPRTDSASPASSSRGDLGSGLGPRTLRRAGNLHRLGLLHLFQGELSRAIRLLEAARKTAPEPRIYSDLAAAYLARSQETSSPEDLLAGLSAARRAVEADPTLPEAAFNLGLALESLALPDQAAIAWDRYLGLDAASRTSLISSAALHARHAAW